MTNQPYDAGDPKNVSNAKRKAYAIDERMSNGIAKICNDSDCRFVLSTFLELAGPFRDTYVTEPRDDARNSGWRAAGLWWLQNALLQDPGILGKMQADTDSPLNIGQENDGRTSGSSNPDTIDRDTSGGE